MELEAVVEGVEFNLIMLKSAAAVLASVGTLIDVIVKFEGAVKKYPLILPEYA